MDIINNPHDKFFKETLGKEDVARDFLQNYLPENILGIIDIDTINPLKDSFIKDLKEYFSDLLFRVNINDTDGYLYFLFEHKSYKDNDVSIQLLKYMIEIWTKFRNEKTNDLPIIIPLVIYHGKQKWDVAKKLSNLFAGYDNLPTDIHIFIPNYEYLLYDLSEYGDEEIKGEAILRVSLDILRHIFVSDVEQLIAVMERAVVTLEELDSKQTGIEYFEVYVRYILSVRDDIPVEKMAKKLSVEGRKHLMSIAEQFRKEGRNEEKKEIAKKMFQLNVDVEQIKIVTGLSEDILRQIKEESKTHE